VQFQRMLMYCLEDWGLGFLGPLVYATASKTIINTDTNARSVQSAHIAINVAAWCVGRWLARRVIVAMAGHWIDGWIDMPF